MSKTTIRAANDRGKGVIIVELDTERFVLSPTIVNDNGYAIYMEHYNEADDDDEMGDSIAVTHDGMPNSSREAWEAAAANFRALADACDKQTKKPDRRLHD